MNEMHLKQDESRVARETYFERCDQLRKKLYELANEFRRGSLPTVYQAREIGDMLEKLSYFLPSEHAYPPGRFSINITITPEQSRR